MAAQKRHSCENFLKWDDNLFSDHVLHCENRPALNMNLGQLTTVVLPL